MYDHEFTRPVVQSEQFRELMSEMGSRPRRDKYFDRSRPSAVVRYIDRLLPEAFDASPLDILDLGCGYGEHMAVLRGLGHRPVGTIHGRDIEDFLLAHQLLGLDVVVHDAAASPLPFRDHSFDVVWSVNVLTLTPFVGRLPSVLAEIRRVLRPGGRTVVRVISKYLPLHGYESVRQLMPPDGDLIREEGPIIVWRLPA